MGGFVCLSQSREKSSIFVMILLEELINVQNLVFNKLLCKKKP